MIGGSKTTKVDLSSLKVPTQPPKWLDNYGKRLWPKLANYLNKNSQIVRADEYLLQQYCSSYDVYRKSYESIKNEGIQKAVYKTHHNPQNGEQMGEPEFIGFKKNPAYPMMSDAINRMSAIGKDLGLSPRARAELLDFEKPEEDKDASKNFKEFFNE